MKTGSAREHRRSVWGPPSTKGCRPTGPRRSLYWLAPSTGLWYFALLAAFAVNLFVWLRLMRQAELQTSAGVRVKLVQVHPQFEVRMDTHKAWMSKAFLGGQIYLPDPQDLGNAADTPVAGFKHGLRMQDKPEIRHVCMYGERCSGTTWVGSLLVRNFHVEIDEKACPNKHDYENSVPNEFLFPAADTLVLAVWRNAFDWAASFYNTPWGAANHCNVTFDTFLTREWSAGELKGTHPYCPKYEAGANYMHNVIHMYYESTMGHSPQDVMELRRWKLQRQVDLCAVRSSSACVQYEGVAADWRGWLAHMRDTYGLRQKRGYPVEVAKYKGLKDHEVYHAHSELAELASGRHTALYNATTIALVQQRLDLQLEAALGYEYSGISVEPKPPGMHSQLIQAKMFLVGPDRQ